MKISARDIDHLSLTLTEPEAAATRLLQLGFNLTPEGVEPRCICFQPDQDDVPNYVELLQGEPVTALALNVAELEGENAPTPGRPRTASRSMPAWWLAKAPDRCPGLRCGTRRPTPSWSRNGSSIPTVRWR